MNLECFNKFFSALTPFFKWEHTEKPDVYKKQIALLRLGWRRKRNILSSTGLYLVQSSQHQFTSTVITRYSFPKLYWRKSCSNNSSPGRMYFSGSHSVPLYLDPKTFGHTEIHTLCFKWISSLTAVIQQKGYILSQTTNVNHSFLSFPQTTSTVRSYYPLLGRRPPQVSFTVTIYIYSCVFIFQHSRTFIHGPLI